MARLESIVGAVLFVSAIAAHLLFGIHAFVRVVGVACILTGIYWSVERKIPVGIEGQPPAFHLKGLPAVVSGVLMMALGACLLFFAPVAACLLGWSHAC
jgi:hypothetical protein